MSKAGTAPPAARALPSAQARMPQRGWEGAAQGRGGAARAAAARTEPSRAGPGQARLQRERSAAAVARGFRLPASPSGKGSSEQCRGSSRGAAGANPEGKAAARCACGCPGALPGERGPARRPRCACALGAGGGHGSGVGRKLAMGKRINNSVRMSNHVM